MMWCGIILSQCHCVVLRCCVVWRYVLCCVVCVGVLVVSGWLGGLLGGLGLNGGLEHHAYLGGSPGHSLQSLLPPAAPYMF